MATRTSHEIWTVGDNRLGQQMNGSTKSPRQLQLVQTLDKCLMVKDIVSGNNGSVYILDSLSNLIVCGQNEVGELGVVDTIIVYILFQWTGINKTGAKMMKIPDDIITLISLFTPKHIPDCLSCIKSPIMLQTFKVKQISSGIGANHKFVINDRDQIYGFGSNMTKQLELSTDLGSQKQRTFTKIDFFASLKLNVVQIACTTHISVFLTDDGAVYTLGSVHNRNNYYRKVGMIQREFVGPTARIKHIACGYMHVMCLDDEGKVYAFGHNQWRQCGCDKGFTPTEFNWWSTTNEMDKLVKIEYFDNNDHKIQQISCGARHTMLLDENGWVHVCGDNTYGQLGHDEAKKTNTGPLLNQYLMEKKVTSIKCGYYHNVAKTDQNEFYLWGDNECFQCLVFEDEDDDEEEDIEVIKIPTKFTFKDHQIVDIYPGFYATQVVVMASTQ